MTSNNLIVVVGRALYGALAEVTGMVGLTPLQVACVLVFLAIAAIGVQLVRVAIDRKGWSLDE